MVPSTTKLRSMLPKRPPIRLFGTLLHLHDDGAHHTTMAGGVEASQRLRHDRLGLIQSGVELHAIRCRGCVSKVIDVDEAHSGDRACARLDVGWHRQIDHVESPSRARSHRKLHLGSRHQMTRRRRRGDHDVGQHAVPPGSRRFHAPVLCVGSGARLARPIGRTQQARCRVRRAARRRHEPCGPCR